MEILLLTGFLGSGKTTLLQRLLEEYHTKKVGIVVNDFGKFNVDAKLVARDGVAMSELSNGSIFCACLKDHFVQAVIDMTNRDLDLLLIEASGLADPSNMEDLVADINQRDGKDIRLVGSLCVVDGDTVLETIELLVAIERQVAYASAILINKVDLIDEDMRRRVKEAIRACNDSAPIYETTYCQVDLQEVLEHLGPNGKAPEVSSNTYESRPPTVMLTEDGDREESDGIPQETLLEFLTELAPSCYRIKGFIRTTEGVKQVSCVGERIQVSDWDEALDTELVIISAVGIRIISVITAALKQFDLKGYRTSL